MSTLEGKVALITGAARGQGRSHAVELANEGADIIALDCCTQLDSVAYPMSTPEDLEETVRLVEKTGRSIYARQADVRSLSAVQEVVTAGVDQFGRLDIICANAGIMPMVGEQGDSEAAFVDAVDVMLKGVWHTLRAGVPSIVAGGVGGSVVITSSMAGLLGVADTDAGVIGYFAAKTGVIGIMRCYAAAHAPDSIRVNVVAPTGVGTPMVLNEEFPKYAMAKPAIAATLSNAMPVMMLEPIDVSRTVLYLVGESGRYVTGTVLPVDAGCQLPKLPHVG